MTHSPLLLQLAIILAAARALGWLLKYLGQPPVIGEMVAGIVLGPIVFGALAPDLHAHVFAPASLPALDGLSQLGLVLFMFIVGAELRLPTGVRSQLIAAGWIGTLSVIVPMLLGLALGPALYHTLAPAGAAFWPFALFMAAAMSITAFPVMARVLKERQMTQTTIGRLSLTGAAVADVLAWVMLALVVALAESGSDWGRLVRMLAGVLALAVLVFGLMRPLLARVLARHASDGRPAGGLLATLLGCTFACAYATTLLNVHPVFGAFLFGACLPRDDRLLQSLIERIEHVAVLVLMPVFFALAGLSTTPDAFAGAGAGALALILLVAIGGKLAGGALGARLAGQPWRGSLAIGTLMNARGLMELIVMKVGLDAGVIGKELFTMLLVMAIVTTMMTGPLLGVLAGRDARAAAVQRAAR
jgi:Kef-type K+ transport system membrane component KefB